jgi:toxin ParE1/3/4
MSAIHRRSKARQDLVEIFRYHTREAGLHVAQRFFAQAEATFTRLAGMPGLGTPYGHPHPALAEVRFFPVARFRKYIVFYRVVADGIEIVRVLHGARDIAGILAEGIRRRGRRWRRGIGDRRPIRRIKVGTPGLLVFTESTLNHLHLAAASSVA